MITTEHFVHKDKTCHFPDVSLSAYTTSRVEYQHYSGHVNNCHNY